MPVLKVAIPVPLRRLFDYRPPANASVSPGQRVLCPFGHREVVGVVVADSDQPADPDTPLKTVSRVLDPAPLIPPALQSLALWAADYYHAAPGEALLATLPALLRQPREAALPRIETLTLTPAGRACDPDTLKRAHRQRQLLQHLQAAHTSVLLRDLQNAGFSRAVIRGLCDRGLADIESREATTPSPPSATPALTPNPAQARAIQAIRDSLDGYACHLLEGVTGSGKTEVYLQAMAPVLARGQQALVLVPEIGLTPQTLARFRERLGCAVGMYHSGLTDAERLDTWLRARRGELPVVLGTRSAVFLPLPETGLIIVDEEHDPSFKQQEGFRYSARDVAIKRGFDSGHPVVLGSATPSAESRHHAREGRYHHLTLPQRAGDAAPPTWKLIDIRHQPLDDGFSRPLLDAVHRTLAQGRQALLFINRRGFAPALLCHDCGWMADCRHCSTRLTLHRHPPRLHCHHCDTRRPVPRHCPDCHGTALTPLGAGTQRSEAALERLFPETPVLRVDRDSTRRKHTLDTLLEQVATGDPCLLVGTQMLAKGHHFPNVTLVGVLDADSALFSPDFRGAERIGQLLMQVAGRAGRDRHPGRILIQTHHPEHPLMTRLLQGDYGAYLDALLQERAATGLPPYGYLALIRAEAPRPEHAEQCLHDTREACAPAPGASLIGPLPAPLERKAGRFRYQLLIHARERPALHATVTGLIRHLEQRRHPGRVRWSVDIDPQDMS